MAAPSEKCAKCGDYAVGRYFMRGYWRFTCACGYYWKRAWRPEDAEQE